MTGFLRPLAYDVISRRDGFGGWQPHRASFRTLVSEDAAAIERQSLGALARMLAHAHADGAVLPRAVDGDRVIRRRRT